MLALNKSDVEDIANGNHNRYVESQDKDELLRELAARLLTAEKELEDCIIDESSVDVEKGIELIDEIESTIECDDDLSDETYNSIHENLESLKDVLQSIAQ